MLGLPGIEAPLPGGQVTMQAGSERHGQQGVEWGGRGGCGGYCPPSPPVGVGLVVLGVELDGCSGLWVDVYHYGDLEPDGFGCFLVADGLGEGASTG